MGQSGNVEEESGKKPEQGSPIPPINVASSSQDQPGDFPDSKDKWTPPEGTTSFLASGDEPKLASSREPPSKDLADKLSSIEIADKPMVEPAVPVGEVAEFLHHDYAKIQDVKGLVQNVHTVEVKLMDLQADPNSPLYSALTFEELKIPEAILKGIYSLKYNKPSKVQEKALPLLLSNPPQNLIAQSQSGTGKTAAFVLTMLCRVDETLKQPQALCLTPSRELARQIVEVVREMGKFTSITVAAAIKEESEHSGFQSRSFSHTAIKDHIIVGTPGTVLEYHKRSMLDFKALKVLVFDEADAMFIKDNMGISVSTIKKVTYFIRCPIATFEDDLMEQSKRLVPNANILSLKREELSVDAIRQFWMRCSDFKSKCQMLSAIYGLLTMGQSIIFVATRDTADKIQAFMELEGYQTANLHGGMAPSERDVIIDRFRSGGSKVLIATNVLARGIDVLQVSLVINFDMPTDGMGRPDPETYLHRIGRTGRFGRSGVSINFISDDRALRVQEHIKQYFNRPITEIATNDLEALDRQLNSA